MKSNYTAQTDTDLAIKIAAKGSDAEAAFKEIYRRYSPMIHAYCMRVLDNEEQAEDIFQDTFIKFYQNIKPEGDDKINVPGFLITIARNLCLNCKRDRRNNVSLDNLDYILQETQNYEQQELLDLIKRSLELLEPEYREAFVLKEYAGLQYNEIAKLTNISLNNAKSRVFRAKQKIKDILQPYLKDLSNWN